MGNPITTAGLTTDLAARQRVVMLGGLALISHGYARTTYDAIIWLDPNEIDMAPLDEIWLRALPLDDGTRLPDAVDLLLSKQLTPDAPTSLSSAT